MKRAVSYDELIFISVLEQWIILTDITEALY